MGEHRDDVGDDAQLALRFRESARGAGRRAPLYRRLSEAIADDPATARLLLHAPDDQRMPVLLFACVHWLLIREPGHELRSWYPNLADARAGLRTDDPYPAFREFCAREEPRLARLLASRTTQTNEIGRGALFLPVLAQVAAERGPIAQLDVGASAGLNLLIDRYRYRYRPDERAGGELRAGAEVVVGPGSPVELTCGTRGPVPVPDAVPPIVDRIGLDQSPIDPTDTAAADWLRACVWPDQADRFARLDAALSMAAVDPPLVVRGDAVDDLAATAGRLDPAGHLIVTVSWVLNYLDVDRRRAFVAALDALAETRPLTCCIAESPSLTEGLPWPGDLDPGLGHLTHLVRVDWRDGRRTIAHCGTTHPHGYWLHWKA